MGKIVCIGNAVVDILLEGLDLKNGIDRNEFVRDFLMTDGIRISVGGDAVNEAIVLGRMGCDVSLVVGLGRDRGGMLIALSAEAAGVHTDQIVWDENGKTQSIILAIQEDKEKYFFCEPDQDSGRFYPVNKMFEGAQIVNLASLFHAPFDSPEIVKKTIQMAKQNGAIVCADIILGRTANLASREMLEAMRGIDYIFPNEEEARLMTEKETLEEQAQYLLDAGIGNAIIKLGAKGCYFKNNSEKMVYPALKVGTMADATGAGDSFLAGFSYGLSQGRCMEDCFMIAGAAGAIAVKSVGATEGLKSLETVKEELRLHNVVLKNGEL